MANIFRNIQISEEIVYIGVPLSDPASPEESEPLPSENGGVPPANETDRLAEDEITWQSGYSQGLFDGALQERAVLNEQINTLNSLLQSIPQAINNNRQQLSTDIADIVLLIVSKFFIHQQQNKEAITQQIDQVILQLNNKQNLEITLHPHDLALIQQNEIQVNLQDCKNVRLKADENLRLGGCIVNSEHGVFDAGIERQIDNLKQVLLRMKSKHE